MSRSHGVPGEFDAQAWAAPCRTPPFYPDAVTLLPGTDATALVARIDTAAPDATIKDSFADLDLTEVGFRVLFEARWIHRSARAVGSAPAVRPPPAPDVAWAVAADPDALRAWALAWDDGDGHADIFRPGLLDDPATVVLAGWSMDGRVVAGAVASRSDDMVGISNVFACDWPDEAWRLVPDAVARLFPTLPMVGYEHGDDLTAAVSHGFEPIGPLRIWLHGQ